MNLTSEVSLKFSQIFYKTLPILVLTCMICTYIIMDF